MRVVSATVLSQSMAWPGVTALRLSAPDLPRLAPGQYVLLGPVGRRDPLLMRPLLAAGHDLAARAVEALVPAESSGPLGASLCTPDLPLTVIGALGRPFVVDSRARRVLLVGAGTLGPLLYLARQCIDQGLEVTFVVGYEIGSMPPPSAALPHEVEYLAVATEPRSERADALLATVEPLVTWADALYVSLPPTPVRDLLTLLRRRLLHLRKGFAQALIAPVLLPCGVGACDLCAITTRAGTRRLCRDGLVFDLLELN